MKVIVAQKGAREHFLAARALHRQGMLKQLVVDWYAPTNPLLKRILAIGCGRRVQGAMATRAPEIPDSMVRPNRINGLLVKWKQSLNPLGGSSYDKALQADKAFTKAVARRKLPPHDVFFGYSYMSLEILETEQGQPTLTILDQVDPGPVHFRLVAEEMFRHQELAGPPRPYPEIYFDRSRREWDLADVIVVNSEWTREALIAEGVNTTKIEILPLAFEKSLDAESRDPKAGISPSRDTLRVLWLGQITPGKGIHYLMEAARLLEGEKVHFDVVGPMGILLGAVAAAPMNMTFHDPVSRDRVAEWYRRSDVFVLPTLSDGFALTQLEALAHGLPVIATPNCGRVVENGETGFLVPARDAQALADAILRFVYTPGLALEMGSHCREAVKAFSVDAYGQRLVEIIEKHGRRKADILKHCKSIGEHS